MGTQSEDLSTVKVLQTPPVVYATYRSKAMVLVLFLLCAAFWFLLRGVFIHDIINSYFCEI